MSSGSNKLIALGACLGCKGSLVQIQSRRPTFSLSNQTVNALLNRICCVALILNSIQFLPIVFVFKWGKGGESALKAGFTPHLHFLISLTQFEKFISPERRSLEWPSMGEVCHAFEY